MTPMPETCHPSLEGRPRQALLGAIERGWRNVEAFVLPRLDWDMYAEDADKDVQLVEPNKILFDIRRAGGPAPFIGDPQFEEAMYFWSVAVDAYGRHVAGPATLEWRRK